MKIPTPLLTAATFLALAILTGCINESSSKVADNSDAQSALPQPPPSDRRVPNLVPEPINQIAPQELTAHKKQSDEPKEKSKEQANDSSNANSGELSNPSDEQNTKDESNDSLPTLQQALDNPVAPNDPVEPEEKVEEVQTIKIPDSWKRLSPKHEIWVDFAAKQVIAAGNICMNAGPLEVFACPRRTKEHESVVSVNALASQIHAALIAIGAEPGHPVKWQEEYQAATGPVIKIDVIWSKDGEQKKRQAQQMVLNVKTGKPMEENWVFGGSATFTDEESGETYYFGDSGELVCLSNFSTATLDVPVKSSDANEGLLYEANTKNIPDFNTKVYLVFKPELPKK